MSDPHTHPDAVDDVHAAIAAQRKHADAAWVNMLAMIQAACPRPHRFVRHRDRRPPWCNACRYDIDGVRIAEKVEG